MRNRFNVLLLSLVLAFIVITVYYIAHQPREQHKLSYLALGDSYTVGYKIRYAENYPNQITALLRQQQLDISDPRIIAYPGWTTADLQRGIGLENIHDTFSFVTLLIGNNDRNEGWSVENYHEHFQQLLDQAISFAAGHPEKVFVLSIPDISITQAIGDSAKANVSKGINNYNIANKEMTQARKCQYIDITYALRDHATDADYYLFDWVHPTAKGYAVWAKQIAPVIAATLK